MSFLETFNLDIIKAVGVVVLIPAVWGIYRNMATRSKASAGESSVYQLLTDEVARLNAKLAEMGDMIDNMRVECAREIRERDDRILALEREVAALAGQIKERHYMDELGRKGLIDRRASRESSTHEPEPA